MFDRTDLPAAPSAGEPAAALDAGTVRLFKRIIVAVSLLVAVGVAEVGMRVLAATGRISPTALPEQSLQYAGAVWTRHVVLAEETTVTLPDGRFFPINDKGYRGRGFDLLPAPGTVRVVIYGGSQVFDQNVSGFDDWPHRVEALLRARGLPVEVINAGIPGHASVDAVGRLLTEGHRWRPDIVVLDNAWNDLKYFRKPAPLLRAMTPMVGRDPRTSYANGVDRALCHASRLYLTLRWRLLSWWLQAGAEGRIELEAPPSDEVSAEGLQQYRANLLAFSALASRLGADPVLMTQPQLARPDTPEAVRKTVNLHYVGLSWAGLCRANDAIVRTQREVAAAHAVALLETAAAVADPSDFTDEVHLTLAGSARLATAVANGLEPLVRARLARATAR